jgi:hypothetical protein
VILGPALLETPTPVPVVLPVNELTPVELPLLLMLGEPSGPELVLPLGAAGGVVIGRPVLWAKAGGLAIKAAATVKRPSFVMRTLPE